MSWVPAACFVCRRAASLGMKYQGSNRDVCMECAELAEEIKETKRAGLDHYEKCARVAAGDKAGAYLDSIRVSFEPMPTEEQWLEFLKTVVYEFGDSVRAQIRRGDPPCCFRGCLTFSFWHPPSFTGPPCSALTRAGCASRASSRGTTTAIFTVSSTRQTTAGCAATS